MSPEASARVRSTIVKVPDASPGLLFINGQQKQFLLDGVWKSPVAPATNMTVDVDLDGAGVITGITVVDAQQLNKERMDQIALEAQQRGKEAAKLARRGVGALAARMGTVALGAAVLVWIAWFFLPSANLAGGYVGSMSFTFWNLLGIDLNNPMTLTDGASNHGFLALLGVVAIIAPFAAPFLPVPWARYLNAAPLGILLIALAAIHSQTSKAFGDLEKMGAPSPFSWSWGVFVLGLAALVLGANALKRPAHA
jgi:hypothetical protein